MEVGKGNGEGTFDRLAALEVPAWGWKADPENPNLPGNKMNKHVACGRE